MFSSQNGKKTKRKTLTLWSRQNIHMYIRAHGFVILLPVLVYFVVIKKKILSICFAFFFFLLHFFVFGFWFLVFFFCFLCAFSSTSDYFIIIIIIIIIIFCANLPLTCAPLKKIEASIHNFLTKKRGYLLFYLMRI